MKVASFSPLLLLPAVSEAFAPGSLNHLRRTFLVPPSVGSSSTTARSFGVDPASFHDHIQTFQDAFSSISISDVMDAAPDLSAVTDAASQLTPDDATVVAADPGNGWFGFLTGPTEAFLKLLHMGVEAVGGSSNSWGISIVLLTLIIKAVTFPLTKTQLESTTKMQAMQPAIKEIQTKYQSNPEVMNQKIAEFYQANEINPLAGCIPSLVQIPVFIGLYRAVLTLAKEDALDQPFLFLPSLEGPTYGADPAHASEWILQGWVDGVPSLGWDDTIAFMILPVFLVISQFVSMELMQPKNPDGSPAPQQGNFVLKLLPLLIGWFSLNVPAALGVYWVTNNIVTTATSLLIRNSLKTADVTVKPSTPASTSTSSAAASTTIFAPPREKPSGFAAPPPAPVSRDAIKPITAIDVEVETSEDDLEESEVGMGMEKQDSPTKKRGKKRKKRKD